MVAAIGNNPNLALEFGAHRGFVAPLAPFLGDDFVNVISGLKQISTFDDAKAWDFSPPRPAVFSFGPGSTIGFTYTNPPGGEIVFLHTDSESLQQTMAVFLMPRRVSAASQDLQSKELEEARICRQESYTLDPISGQIRKMA